MSDWLSSALGLTVSREEEKPSSPKANGSVASPEAKKLGSAEPTEGSSASAHGKAGGAQVKRDAHKAPNTSSSSSTSSATANGTAEKSGSGAGDSKKKSSNASPSLGSSKVAPAPPPAEKDAPTAEGSASSAAASATAQAAKSRSASGSAQKERSPAKDQQPAAPKKAAAEASEPSKKPAPADRMQEKKQADAAKASSGTASAAGSAVVLDTLEKRQAAAAAAAAAAGSEATRRSSTLAASNANANAKSHNPSSLARAGALRRIRVSEALPELISQAQACTYEAAEFFVAWQGVLTIIYTGIPPSLCRLKARMAEQFPGLPPENPGSLWPKTSLACLKDDKRLSPEQLQQLRDICSKMNFQLVYSSPIHVSTVSVVLYENCCLERQLLTTHIQLQQSEDPSPVSEEQRAHVRQVADEFSPKNIANYWFHVSKDGNRSKHYRQSKAGATLVHFLGDEVPPSVATFQRLVEAAMPGMYDWFPTETLHITLRALC